MASDAARAAPVGSPGNWLTSGDYPTDLLRQGAIGVVHFRLNVDEKGAVTGCHVQMSSMPAEFEVTTCKLFMRRAKFNPGHNAKGEPIKSYFISSVRWSVQLN
jgi:TonB family protein